MATDSDRDLPVNSASIESTGRRNLIDLIPSNMAAPNFTASDLDRISFESFVSSHANQPGRNLSSRGRLHVIEGDSSEHRADMRNLSKLLLNFQNLADSVGGALNGHRSNRGKLPSTVLEKTRLDLNASPMPGSVVFSISPRILPSAELEGRDTAFIDPETDQLLDLVFPKINELFGLMVALPDDPAQELEADNSILANQLRELGPRVASSLHHLADSSYHSNLSLDLSWEEPGRPTLQSDRLTPSLAERAAKLISHSSTDEEESRIMGVMRTVSDITALAITPFENGNPLETIHVVGSDLPEGSLEGIEVGSCVVIEVVVTRTSGSFSGEEGEKYRATAIRLLGD